MDRRSFLKTLGAASLCALGPASANASQAAGDDRELYGVLVDTTVCVGCRTCEEACAEDHGLPIPDIDDFSVTEVEREPSETALTVVNFYDTDDGEMSVKKQCMHCTQPSCAAACLTNAMHKTPQGPIVWREDKCMGCRFCMVSCPFDVPAFEYHSANPRVMKCDMCWWKRVKEGRQPACVENCPFEALTFGKRTDLIEEARRRIYESPDDYVHEIYGEHEVGATGYLYLASVPFSQLGFRTDLGTTAPPEFTTGFLYSVPIVLTLWPGLLLAISNATKRDDDKGSIEDERTESGYVIRD